MPRVTTISGISINVNPDDHNPPHVHATYQNSEALIEIASGMILKGTLPAKKAAAAKTWIYDNKHNLQILWKELNPDLRD